MTDPSAHAHPEALRVLAVDLADAAAQQVRRRRAEVFGAGPSGAEGAPVDAVRTKSSPTDPVTVVDTEIEALLGDWLARRRPADAVLGEEGGGREDTAAGQVTWVLDPIDGTVNFLYGIPQYGVSIAAVVDGRPVAGAVADVAAGAVYSAALGGGAHRSGSADTRRLRVNTVDELAMALLGTGFAYQADTRARQVDVLAALLPTVRDLRRFGSAALDLCMVADGRLDIYYEDGLHGWDWAAGSLIAAEAGAVVTTPGGVTRGLVTACAPGVAADFAAALAAAVATPGRRG